MTFQAIDLDYFQQDIKADQYIHSIRNQRKRDYAKAYWLHLRHGGIKTSRGELSLMAAQAVEMRLREIGNY